MINFCLKTEFFEKLPNKYRIFLKICLKKLNFSKTFLEKAIFFQIERKNQNFSEICLVKWTFFGLRSTTRQISNQIDAAALNDIFFSESLLKSGKFIC